MARMQTLRTDGFLLRPLLSLFSALVLCGLLMLFGLTTRGTIEVGGTVRVYQLPRTP